LTVSWPFGTLQSRTRAGRFVPSGRDGSSDDQVRVELRGFGAFSVKNRPARTGRNPRTGAHVSVEKKSVPFFKTGKEMRERLNRTST